MRTMLLFQAPSPSPSAPDCLKASDLCKAVYDATNNAWLASSSYYVIVKPIRILLIILVALIVRWIAHRAISRLIRRTVKVSFAGALPKSVESALPDAFRATPRPDEINYPERRRQRAEAIGSVLKSFTSATIFSIALLMIMAELGIDLGPLLASAGIAGIALGFGAQTLVKDIIAGLFMLLEDQYGVGDSVDLGEASGVVESVGLRITSIRDNRGVLWHVRNGEIVRVGNRSQGWALVVIDVPVGFARVEDATAVLEAAGLAFAEDPQWADDIVDPPAILGVERVTVDGAVLRATVKTPTEAQARVGRELRTRLTTALMEAGIMDAIQTGRVFVRPPTEEEPPTPPS
jgi:moderate conductance mechanosensitive channel